MSRAETTRLPLLDALLEAGPDGASREELSRLANTSTSSFYRIIKPMLREGIVVESDWAYRLPLDNLYNYRYKLWRDAERLYHLDEATRSAILSVLSQARVELRSNLQAIWLVGSAAHGNLKEDSDLDFLLVLRQDQDFSPILSRPVQVITETQVSFGRKFHQEDSFLASALRHGLLLQDNGFAQDWLNRKMTIQLDDELIKATQDMLEHHYRRLGFFIEGDEPDEVRRWLKAGATTLGRALLALYGYVPAGRPDLLNALTFYYGSFSESIRAALDWQSGDHNQAFALYSNLDRDWLKFKEMRRALNQLTVPLLSLSGSRFVQVASAAIYILIQDVIPNKELILVDRRSSIGDFQTSILDGRTLVVECKAGSGPLKLEKLTWPAQRREVHLVIGNPFSSVEPLKRDWNLSPASYEALRVQGVDYLDAHELLLSLTTFYLQGQRPEWRQTLRFSGPKLST